MAPFERIEWGLGFIVTWGEKSFIIWIHLELKFVQRVRRIRKNDLFLSVNVLIERNCYLENFEYKKIKSIISKVDYMVGKNTFHAPIPMFKILEKKAAIFMEIH
jgi:hypothetical protein